MPPEVSSGGNAVPVALTVAGSDSGGGAGIQADLRTFAALEVFGTSVVTAVTAQNTRGVTAVHAVTLEVVRAQLEAVLSDFVVGAVKTGMLATAELTETVAHGLRDRELPLVVDPVMVAKSGDSLLDDAAVASVLTALLPLATVVTPNLPEAERLTGRTVRTEAEQADAAQALVDAGAGAALVKGGHADGDPVDVLITRDGDRLRLGAVRVDTPHTHGTGCTYSAAIAARLARGDGLVDAVRAAHAYLQDAIRQAPGLGAGHGPLHHMHPWYRWPPRT